MSKYEAKGIDLLKCLLNVSTSTQQIIKEISEKLDGKDDSGEFKEDLWELEDGTILIRATELDENGNRVTIFYTLDGEEYEGSVEGAKPYARDFVSLTSDIWVDCEAFQVITFLDPDTNQEVGLIYRNPLNGEILSDLPLGDVKLTPCKEKAGLSLEEGLGNGTYTTPFKANYIRVSYLPVDVRDRTPIIITLEGDIEGNRSFKVYPNTNEAFSFDEGNITGYTIERALEDRVDVELKS